MCNKNTSTIVRKAQNLLADRQTRQGYITALQWAEYQQALAQSIDADRANREWLQAYGLADVNPSEIFASAS